MPIVVGTNPDLSPLGVIDRQSPYSLRINGEWVVLGGVVPGSARTIERPRSELVTVDGLRYAQQAPRGAREWSLSLVYAGPAAIAALALAAEAPGAVWLHDDAAARANMLHSPDCYGHDTAAAVLDCGGVPLRALDVGVDVFGTVRGGVTTRLSCWTTEDEDVPIVDLTYPGGSVTVLAPAGVGSRRAEAVFVASADGSVRSTPMAVVSGLQVTEGPGSVMWLAGERSPCPVMVLDPDRVLNLLPSGKPMRSDYSVTLREVGEIGYIAEVVMG